MVTLTPHTAALIWVVALLIGIVLGLCKGKKEERYRCARIASMFTMKPDRSIHPDIPWDQMNESAKMAAHTTAQQIAVKIMEGE